MKLVLSTSPRVGYGWFRSKSERYGETAYYMNGRAPGFASFILYLPARELTIVALSNIYSSATTTIGYDIASIVPDLPHDSFRPQSRQAGERRSFSGRFQFGPDFYQKDATLQLVEAGEDVMLVWPTGDRAALIPVGADEFIDRSYWERIKIERDAAGQPTALMYDQFRGNAVKGP